MPIYRPQAPMSPHPQAAQQQSQQQQNQGPSVMDLLMDQSSNVTQVLQAIMDYLERNKDGAQLKIHSFYKEVRRIVEAYDLSNGIQIRPDMNTLASPLSATQLTNPVSYRQSETEDFCLLEFRGFYACQDWETNFASMGVTDPKSNILVQSNLVTIDFRLKDKSDRVYTNTQPIQLSTILPEAGGLPIRWDRMGAPPFVIPHNTWPQVTPTFNTQEGANPDLIAGAAQYGATLIGVHVSRPR